MPGLYHYEHQLGRCYGYEGDKVHDRQTRILYVHPGSARIFCCKSVMPAQTLDLLLFVC